MAEGLAVLDPRDLYVLTADLPELTAPVLVSTLPGFVDAGSAGRLVSRHIMDNLPHRPLATFDADQLIDHRSHRPVMTFVEDHWDGYTQHQLAVHLVEDATGTPFLLLAGPEPDYQWERFTTAVQQVVDRFGVRLTVGTNAIPMTVPHTRPTGLTAHATRPELVTDYEPWLSTVQVPGSVGALLEYRLGQAGRDAMGFAVHVPHYVAQAEYPAAAIALLDAIERATGLSLAAEGLATVAEVTRVKIDEQVERSTEIASVVRALEEQFDAMAGTPMRQQPLLAVDGEGLPTADELGAELERYLAERNPKDD